MPLPPGLLRPLPLSPEVSRERESSRCGREVRKVPAPNHGVASHRHEVAQGASRPIRFHLIVCRISILEKLTGKAVVSAIAALWSDQDKETKEEWQAQAKALAAGEIEEVSEDGEE